MAFQLMRVLSMMGKSNCDLLLVDFDTKRDNYIASLKNCRYQDEKRCR